MPFTDSFTRGGSEDEKINSRYQSLMKNMKKSMDATGEDVHENPHNAPPHAGTYEGPMKGPLMGWTQMLEAMDEVSDAIDAQATSVEDTPVSDETDAAAAANDPQLLDDLNKLYTPVLVMQGLENDIADKANAEISEATVLTEKNMISFDDPSKMAQLISVCALLIAKKKNTQKWQMYKKAAAIKTKTKLDIQKEEYDAAKQLAQAYLVKVSTTNNSSVARDAANKLLPQTQH